MQKYATEIGWTDRKAHEIVKQVSPKCIEIRRLGATLLNGANSGEPDALQFQPGGFCGHTSGTQRYKFEQTNLPVVRIRLHKDGLWYDKHGQKYRLADEPCEFYDFNF